MLQMRPCINLMNKNLSSRKDLLYAALCFIVLLVSIVYLFASWNASRVETDLLALLPKQNKIFKVEKAKEVFLKQVSSKMLFLFSASDMNLAVEEAEFYASELKSSGFFSAVDLRQDSGSEDLLREFYFPFRQSLFSDEIEAHLKTGSLAKILKRVEKILVMPVMPGLSTYVKQDPLFLYLDFISNIKKPPGSYKFQNGYVYTSIGGEDYLVLQANLSKSIFQRDFQISTSAFIRALNQKFKSKFPDGKVLQSGALSYAEAGAENAERDLKLIGFGSSLIVLLLFLLVFRNIKYLFIAITSVLLSTVFSLSLVILVFQKIHVITLAFGASLIGVCSDYSYHFFCHRLGREDIPSKNIISEINTALFMAVITSILGYVGLLFIPFPGLNQMAVFSVAGIFSSYLIVRFFYSFIPHAKSNQELRSRKLDLSVRQLASGFFNRISLIIRIFPWWLTAACLMLISSIGLFRLNTNDDVRSLQLASPELQTMEKSIKAATGNFDQSRFFLLFADQEESLLKKEEKLARELRILQTEKVLEGFQATVDFVPSEETQQRKAQSLLHNLNASRDLLLSEFDKLGFERSSIEKYLRQLQGETKYLHISDWQNSKLFSPLKFLWLGKIDQDFASIIILRGISDLPKVKTLESKEGEVYFIDFVNDAGSVLKTYRITASQYVFIFYFFVYLVIAMRYGFAKAALAITPAVLSVVLNLSLHGFFGIEINLFSMLAMIIVLGLSIDYSIFLIEDETHTERTMLLIILSALSTLASFGLLAFSKTPVLFSFGIAVFFGILLTIFLCPIVSNRKSKNET